MTGNLGLSLDSQDAYSANALMQLGARDGVQSNAGIAGLTPNAAVLDESHLPANGLPAQWPMNIFDG